MKEKILAFLKTNTKLAGVQENYLLGVAEHYSKTITEDSQIATTLTDGVIDLLKVNAEYLQKEGDRRATEAGKTAVKTFQEKHGLDENGKPKGRPADPPKTDPDPTMPEWAKQLIEDNKTLKSKLENQEKEKSSVALIGKVKAHPKLKDIPASYLNGRNLVPQSEAEIDNLVASIETDYNAFKQEMAEKGVVISVPPVGGGLAGDKSTIDEYLNEKFPKEPQGKVLIPKN